MKTRLLFLSILMIGFLESCNITVIENIEPEITLQERLQSFELWYVDINATSGSGEIPFLQKAFTVSFLNNRFYANNNLVNLGSNGNGFGLNVGNYSTFRNTLNINHVVDGSYSLEVYPINFDEIEIYDPLSDTSYRLIGYQRSEFDYDAVFYDNIEYFLQEYEVWNKISTSDFGDLNAFDAENYLRFFPDRINVFQSSQDKVGTDIDLLKWDFEGTYEVFDVAENPSVKILTLDYDLFDNETFELTILNNATIQLYHRASGTEYLFAGKYNIAYLKGSVVKKERKRFKVKRKIKTI
ncbi:MAG: nicotinic acid mononucleotide adenyltransferase [Flavobacteriaceae bacterium]|nr:nicotinic acid mononucleotide adenyltransferase [Flavobacteriaceae bacterium]